MNFGGNCGPLERSGGPLRAPLLGRQQGLEARVVHCLGQRALHGGSKGIGHIFAGTPGIPAGIEAVAVFHLQGLAIAGCQRHANLPAGRTDGAEGELVDPAANRHRGIARVGLGQEQFFLKCFADEFRRGLART